MLLPACCETRFGTSHGSTSFESDYADSGLPGTPVESQFGQAGRNRRCQRGPPPRPQKLARVQAIEVVATPRRVVPSIRACPTSPLRLMTNCWRSVASYGFSMRGSSHYPRSSMWRTSPSLRGSRPTRSADRCRCATVSPTKDSRSRSRRSSGPGEPDGNAPGSGHAQVRAERRAAIAMNKASAALSHAFEAVLQYANANAQADESRRNMRCTPTQRHCR